MKLGIELPECIPNSNSSVDCDPESDDSAGLLYIIFVSMKLEDERTFPRERLVVKKGKKKKN